MSKRESAKAHAHKLFVRDDVAIDDRALSMFVDLLVDAAADAATEQPIETRGWAEMPMYLTAGEFARIMRVTKKTAMRRIREGEIPALMPGNEYLIHRDDARAYIEGDDTDAD